MQGENYSVGLSTMSQKQTNYQIINLIFAKNFQLRPEYLTKNVLKIPKINKRTGPNKSVQGGSLVKIK